MLLLCWFVCVRESNECLRVCISVNLNCLFLCVWESSECVFLWAIHTEHLNWFLKYLHTSQCFVSVCVHTCVYGCGHFAGKSSSLILMLLTFLSSFAPSSSKKSFCTKLQADVPNTCNGQDRQAMIVMVGTLILDISYMLLHTHTHMHTAIQ